MLLRSIICKEGMRCPPPSPHVGLNRLLPWCGIPRISRGDGIDIQLEGSKFIIEDVQPWPAEAEDSKLQSGAFMQMLLGCLEWPPSKSQHPKCKPPWSVKFTGSVCACWLPQQGSGRAALTSRQPYLQTLRPSGLLQYQS